MSQIPIPLLGVTSTAAQFKFATSTDTSAGAVRIEYSGAGAGLFIRSTGATAYYPPAIILSNAAYGTESRITTAHDNGILFQSNTPASWVFTASFSGAQSVARIKSTTAAVSDTGVLEIDTGYAAQAGIRVKLAATPTADAFQVYASDGTTKLVSLSPTNGGLLQFYGVGSGTGNDWSGISRSGNGALQIHSRAISADEGLFLFPSTTEGVRMASGLQLGWSSSLPSSAANDTGLARIAAGIIKVTNGSTGAGALEFLEQTAPSSATANSVRIYAQDNGAGKTQLMALFATGAAQQIAIEP